MEGETQLRLSANSMKTGMLTGWTDKRFSAKRQSNGTKTYPLVGVDSSGKGEAFVVGVTSEGMLEGGGDERDEYLVSRPVTNPFVSVSGRACSPRD
jgi:hypothetical protein